MLSAPFFSYLTRNQESGVGGAEPLQIGIRHTGYGINSNHSEHDCSDEA